MMEYLSICFEEQCRLEHKQIVSVRNPDSQLHYNEFHAVEAIHPDAPFIRSFKTQPIIFKETFPNVHSQLQEQYERSVERVKSALRVGLQQYARRIRDIYELNGEEITLKLFEPHLREKTLQTELWLTLLTWKKDHPTEDMKGYVQNMPETLIKQYAASTINLVDSFLYNLPKSPNSLQKESPLVKMEELQADLKGGLGVIQAISKQMSNIYDLSIKPKEIHMHSETPLIMKGKDLKEGALLQLAEVFLNNSKSNIQYRGIGESLQTKIQSGSNFQFYMRNMFRKIYMGIEGLISNDLRYRRGSEINFVVADLKKYRIWMQKDVADIFARCVRFFIKLYRDIVINMYEIYIIYVTIIIRIIKKIMKNEILFPCDSPAERSEIDMMYLYNHFGNFYTVAQLVTKQYQSAQLQSVKQSMKKTWRKIVIDTYALIKENYHIQNVQFCQLVFQEQDFSRQQFWGGIVRQYTNYRLHRKMKKSERKSLEQSMMIVVRNGRSLQRFSNEGADPSFETDAGNEIALLASSSVSSVETMIEESSQNLQCSSKAKREQLSSLEVSHDEIKQQGSQAQSFHLH